MSIVIIITPKPPPKTGGRSSESSDGGDDSLRIEMDEVEGESAAETLRRAADQAE